jgi:RimJ/RimL family protein N-acetyltransferase
MDRVYLRALELDDSTVIVKWRNDRKITDPLGGNTFYVSGLREAEWVKNQILDDRRNVRLAICVSSGQLIGIVSLTQIDHLNQCAEFSIMIGEKTYWGKGFGRQATDMCLKHAFEELNLYRVYLSVRSDNETALAMYLKSGFVEEGTFRKSVFKNGERIDMKIMSILKEEFTWQKL